MSGGDRAEFLDIWQQHVTRPGSEKLLDWLDKKTDFFTAPASTRFHGPCCTICARPTTTSWAPAT